ncbi:MAG: ABC transporter ATPase [Flavobacteriales bacterium]
MKELNRLADHSRIWLYQAERYLTEEEVELIKQSGQVFMESWTSHGANMDAAIEVLHQRFIVIALDEQTAPASGCGIDKSVQFVKDLSESMRLDFFQRTIVLYESVSGWAESSLHQFWAMRKALIVNDETRVFDTTVRTLGELREKLIVPFHKSWHADMWGR